MGNISDWTTQTPSGSSALSLGATRLRSDFSILQDMLNEEHFFAPSSNTTRGGVHRLGSARVFVASRSTLSTPSVEPAGRLFVSHTAARPENSLHVILASSHTTLRSGVSTTGRALAVSNNSLTPSTKSYLLFGGGATYGEGPVASTNTVFGLHGAGTYLVRAGIGFEPTGINGLLELGVEVAGGETLAVSGTSLSRIDPVGHMVMSVVTVSGSPVSLSFPWWSESSVSPYLDAPSSYVKAVKLL